MAVNFKNDPERIFDVAHPIWLLAGIIFSDRHTLFTAGRDDLFHQSFDVRVLNTEVKSAVALMLEIVFWGVVLRKFEDLNANSVSRGQVGYLETFPIRAESYRVREPRCKISPLLRGQALTGQYAKSFWAIHSFGRPFTC